jgi:hypothetical protein
VREHVDGHDAGDPVARRDDCGQFRRERLRVARHVHRPRGPDGFEDPANHAGGAAFARRIQHDGGPGARCSAVPRARAETGERLLHARGDQPHAARRNPVDAEVLRGIPHRLRVLLHHRHGAAAERERQAEQSAAAVEIEHAIRALGRDGREHLVEHEAGGFDVRLEEGRRRDEERGPEARLAHLPAAADDQRLAPDHEGARLVVDVDGEAGRRIGPREHGADRRAQALVVACDDEHRDGLASVHRGPDDEVARDASEVRSRARDARAGERVADGEGDTIAPRAVDGALVDRDDAVGAAGEVAHHEAAPAGTRSEDERDLLAEAPRCAAGWRRRASHRFDRRRAPAERAGQQGLQAGGLAAQLLVVRHVLRRAAAALAEVPASGRGPGRRACVPIVGRQSDLASAGAVRPSSRLWQGTQRRRGRVSWRSARHAGETHRRAAGRRPSGAHQADGPWGSRRVAAEGLRRGSYKGRR